MVTLMYLGIGIADRDLGHDAGVEAARLADEGGTHSVWTKETGGAAACVTLGAWTQVTHRVKSGTGVIPLSARSIATLALVTRQLASLVPDRVLMSIGVGQ